MGVRIVGAILETSDRRHIALEVRGDGDTHAGCWGLIGGAVEPDETADDAIRREMDEETNIDFDGLGLRQLGALTIPAEVTGGDELAYTLFRGTAPQEPFLVRDAAGVVRVSPADALANGNLTPVARYILNIVYGE